MTNIFLALKEKKSKKEYDEIIEMIFEKLSWYK